MFLLICCFLMGVLILERERENEKTKMKKKLISKIDAIGVMPSKEESYNG